MNYIKQHMTPTDWRKILNDLKEDEMIIQNLTKGWDYYEVHQDTTMWVIDDKNNSYLFRMPGRAYRSTTEWYLFYYQGSFIEFGLRDLGVLNNNIFEIKAITNSDKDIKNLTTKAQEAMQLAINKFGYSNLQNWGTIKLTQHS